MITGRTALRDGGLVLLAAVTLAAAGYVVTRTPGATGPADQVSAPLRATPTVMRSEQPAVRALLVGSDGDLAPALEEQLGWEVDTSVVPGTGFVAGNGQSLVARLPGVLERSDADVVVLSTGTAEGEEPDLRRYGANAAFALNAVREALPEARVVLVGPVAVEPESYSGVRGQLTAVAARFGAFYVDPVGRRYVADYPSLLEPDGTLGPRGREQVGRLVAEDLERVLPADLLDVNGG